MLHDELWFALKNTRHKLPNNKHQESIYQLPVADDPIINIKNQSTSCHHSSLNTQGKGDGVGGTEAGTNSHLDLPFLCALTVSRKTSNSSSRSLGPAMFSGWNCTLTTPRVWTVFTSKCQHFRWHSDSTRGLNRVFASKFVNISADNTQGLNRIFTSKFVNTFAENTQGLNRVLLQHLSTFLLTTPWV